MCLLECHVQGVFSFCFFVLFYCCWTNKAGWLFFFAVERWWDDKNWQPEHFNTLMPQETLEVAAMPASTGFRTRTLAQDLRNAKLKTPNHPDEQKSVTAVTFGIWGPLWWNCMVAWNVHWNIWNPHCSSLIISRMSTPQRVKGTECERRNGIWGVSAGVLSRISFTV